LAEIKIDRPWYKAIHSQVLQELPKKVDLAFDKWLKGDSHRKKLGRPRFKTKRHYKTFTYPHLKQHHFVCNEIMLSKIGNVKVIVHRQIPQGFESRLSLLPRSLTATM
jgi:putative transposase